MVLLLASVALGIAGELHDAARVCDENRLRGLLAGRPPLNETNDGGRTPLHFAAAMGRLRAVETLVVLGADAKAKDAQGRTPVEAAERAGLAEAVQILKREAPKE